MCAHETQHPAEPSVPAPEANPGLTERVPRLLLGHWPFGPLVRWVAGLRASVHAKLLAAFLLVAVLLIAMGAMSLQAIATVSRQSRLLDQARERVDASRQIEHALGLQMSSTRNALLVRDDATIESILREQHRFDETLSGLERLGPPGQRETIQRIRAAQGQVMATVTRIAALIREGKADEAMALHLDESEPLHREIATLVTQAVRTEEAGMGQLRQNVESTERRALVLMGAFAAASIFLALGLGFVISWSFILPVRKAERFLGQIAQGDFGSSIEVPNRDEFGSLAGRMNHMSRELHELYEAQRRAGQELHARNDELRIALEQQTATSDLLKVIGRSTFDLQPVFETMADSAVRLCAAERAIIHRFDGRFLEPAVIHNPTAELRELAERTLIEPGRGSASGRAILERRTIHIHDVQADPEYTFPAARLAEPIRTVLAIPMLRADELLGVIVIYRHEVLPFSDSQIALMETFADQAAIAIENARLLTELQSKNANLTEALEQQTATAEILRVISGSPTDIQPVLDTMAESAARLCEASDAAIFRLDGERLVLVAHRGPIPYGTIGEYTIPVVHGTVMGRTILEARTVHVKDLPIESAEFPEGSEIARQLGHRTTLCVPLMREGVAIGGINVRRTEAQLFTERQVALLSIFADQAIIAIENVRLFTELASRNGELRVALEQQTATSELLKVIGRSSFDLQPVFESLAEHAVRLCQAERALIYRFDGQVLRIAATHNVAPEHRAFVEGHPIAPGRHSAAARAALEQRTIHIDDIETDSEYTYGVMQVDPIRTVLAIPMLRADELLGVIVIYRLDVMPFTASQIALMETFADQAAIAVENARLLKELQAKNADLTEALEQQTATAEILRVISRSPTDVQPVFDAIAESSVRLCSADYGCANRLEDDVIHLVAQHGQTARWLETASGLFPHPLTRDLIAGRAMLDREVVHVADMQSDARFSASQALARTMGYHTALSVPMLRDNGPVGAIVVFRQADRPFTEAEIGLLRTFADQAVIAIENVRLFTELEARNSELRVALEQQTATSELLKVIGRSTFDLQPVFETLAENAVRLCEAERGFIWRPDGQLLRAVVMHNASPELREYAEQNPMAPGRGSGAARAALERRIVHIPDALADPEYTFGIREVDPIRTVLAIPMVKAEELLGVIAIYRLEVRPFTESQIALMETFADQAAIAIENARLLTELQTKNANLTEALEQQTATAEILRVISSSPTDIQPVLDTVAECAARLCESHDASILRRDGDQLLLVAHHGPIDFGTPGEFSLALVPGMTNGRSVLDARTIHVADLQSEVDEFPEGSATARQFGFRTALNVPLMREGVAIGSISLRRTEARLFTERQVALLQTFADQAVIAIENVRLFTELEARNGELRVALEQQTATSELLKVMGRSTFDLGPVFEMLAENAIRLCEAQQAFIYRFDGGLLRVVAAHNVSAELIRFAEENPIAPGRHSGAARAALERRTIHIADVQADPEYTYGAKDVGPPLRTLLSIPMLRAGELFGVIHIYRLEVRLFTDSQIALVETFADQAAIAIENARLFTELQAKNISLTEALEQQTATAEILRVISRSPTDVQPVFEAIAESSVRLCRADYGGAYKLEGGAIHFGAHHGHTAEWREAAARLFPLPLTRELIGGAAMLDREVVHLDDLQPDERFPASQALAKTMGYRTALAVPMLREDGPVGAIVVFRQERRPFTDGEIGLVRTFADQAVIAIQNVRLFTELEARNSELRAALEQQTATSELLKVIGRSTFDLQPVFETLAENAVRLCEAKRSFIFRFDGQVLRVVATHNASAELRTFVEQNPIAPGRGSATARAALEQRAVHVHDAQADPEYTYGSRQVDPFRTILTVPMVRAGELLGVILTYRHEVLPFTDSQIALLETFADQAAIAIENARLLTELQTKNASLTEALEQQTATSEILGVISSSPTDVQPVFETIAANALRLCDATFSAVFRFDGELIHLAALYNWSDPAGADTLRRAFPMPPGRAGTVSRAVLTRAVEYVPDVREDPDYRILDVARAAAYTSSLSVPMLRGGSPIGVINVSSMVASAFSDTQIELVKTFADQAVIAVENVRLFTELESRNGELRLALERQTATAELLKVIGRSTFDLQPVFETLAENAVRLCEAERAFVFRFDGQTLRVAASYGASPELIAFVEQNPIAPGRHTGTARAALERRTIHIHDILADPEYTYGVNQVDTVRTVLAIPILRADELLGVFMIYKPEVRPFTDGQIALMETFADQAAIAIENARLLTELQARTASSPVPCRSCRRWAKSARLSAPPSTSRPCSTRSSPAPASSRAPTPVPSTSTTSERRNSTCAPRTTSMKRWWRWPGASRSGAAKAPPAAWP
jgi:two-component system, NtrC family, sensor kinase